jgi:hypothetical protein
MFRLLARVFGVRKDREWEDDYGSDPLATEDPDDSWAPA